MLVDSKNEASFVQAVPSRAWQLVAAVLLCVAIPLLIFAPTLVEMAGIWRRSETYAHCFVVFPVFVYLVWAQRAELQDCPVRPMPVALAAVFGFGLLWALGTLSAALTPSFFGLIGLSVATVIAVLGWRVARVIWVPLLFLFFAVPFGEVFVPTLVEWTADFTVAAIAASGVPVFREGPNFVVPSGQWSVVDACSGIRYLLASMFAGALYAWLMYRSTVRRLAFMAASIVVPIVANWFRAYLIVMLGHLSDNRIAGGVDHLIYGWIFFGLVMLLLFWVGSLFREDIEVAGKGVPAHRASPTATPTNWRPILPLGIAVIAIAIGWQAAAARLAESGDERPVHTYPVMAANGWTPLEADVNAWRPQLHAPSATLSQRFEKDGRQVTLFVGVYRNQSQESELVNTLNYLLHVIVSPWSLVSQARPTVDLGRVQVRVNSALGRRYGETMGVWQWHWVRGRSTTNDVWAKAQLALDRLLARSDTSAWVAISSTDEMDGRAIEGALKDFAADMGPAIDDALRKTAER